VTNVLPTKYKEEMDELVKLTIQMKSKLNSATSEIDESIGSIVGIAEEIELAKLQLNRAQDEASGGTELHISESDDDA
jgi:hypothetical protein